MKATGPSPGTKADVSDFYLWCFPDYKLVVGKQSFFQLDQFLLPAIAFKPRDGFPLVDR